MADNTLFYEMKKKARENCIPIGGKFELTPRCTLDCKMCYVHLSNSQMNERKELSASEWIRIIDDAYENGLLFSLLTGGECMLHPGFAEIYEHLYDLGVYITVNTNGLYIHDAHLELMKRLPPRAINVSLYGASDDAYERVTGVRAFERVAENIRKLRDSGFNISISITVSRYLKSEVISILEFCKKERLHFNISYSLMDAREETGRSIDNFGLTAEEEIAVRKQVLLYLKGKLYNNPKNCKPAAQCSTDSICIGTDCNAGRGSYLVTWEGVMCPCFSMTEIRSSLLENSFKKAWEEISTASQQVLIPAECMDCDIRPVCSQCFVNRANPDDPRHCNPDMCKSTMMKIDSGVVKFPK